MQIPEGRFRNETRHSPVFYIAHFDCAELNTFNDSTCITQLCVRVDFNFNCTIGTLFQNFLEISGSKVLWVSHVSGAISRKLNGIGSAFGGGSCWSV